MNIYLLIAGAIFFSLVLIKATDILTDGLHEVVSRTKVNAFGFTAFILALATSFPELFVGITSGLHNNPEISMGNVIGSNIANLTLVLGGAALLAGSLKAYDKFLTGEVFHTFLSGTLPLVMLLDGKLSRLDGLVLLVVYVLYNMTVLGEKRKIIKQRQEERGVWYRRWWYKLTDKDVERSMGKMVIGVAMLIFSADMLVRIAEQVAMKMNLPMALVGMILVAVGTSLPELSFEVAAIKKKETQMALGNILGSVVANSTLILGITVILSPLVLVDGLRTYLIAVVAFVIGFLFFWLFVRTKQTLDRWEGLVLVLLYVMFVLFEFARVQNGYLLV